MKTPFLETTYEIHNYHTDFCGNITPSALVNYMQHAAGEHATKNQLGYYDLIGQGRAWVLSRMRIKVYNPFKWNELIHLKTWVHDADRLFSHRHFALSGSNGEIQVHAATDWALLDMNTRRPVRLDEYVGEIPVQPHLAAFTDGIAKVELPKNAVKIYEKIPQISDLDVNMHVNNVRYLEWMMNVFDFEFMKSKRLAEVSLNYRNEAFFGEDLELYCAHISEFQKIVAIKRKNDGKEVCLGEFVFC